MYKHVARRMGARVLWCGEGPGGCVWDVKDLLMAWNVQVKAQIVQQVDNVQ